MRMPEEFYPWLESRFAAVPETAENLRRIARHLESIDVCEVRHISLGEMAGVMGKAEIDEDVMRVSTILANAPVPLLRPKWLFEDAQTHEEHVISSKDVLRMSDSGEFTHPRTGELVETPDEQIFLPFEIIA